MPPRIDSLSEATGYAFQRESNHCALDAREKATVWAVTHAGVIRTVTARALGMPLARCVRWPLEMGAIVCLRYDASSAQWLLSRWNA